MLIKMENQKQHAHRLSTVDCFNSHNLKNQGHPFLPPPALPGLCVGF